MFTNIKEKIAEYQGLIQYDENQQCLFSPYNNLYSSFLVDNFEKKRIVDFSFNISALFLLSLLLITLLYLFKIFSIQNAILLSELCFMAFSFWYYSRVNKFKKFLTAIPLSKVKKIRAIKLLMILILFCLFTLISGYYAYNEAPFFVGISQVFVIGYGLLLGLLALKYFREI